MAFASHRVSRTSGRLGSQAVMHCWSSLGKVSGIGIAPSGWIIVALRVKRLVFEPRGNEAQGK